MIHLISVTHCFFAPQWFLIIAGSFLFPFILYLYVYISPLYLHLSFFIFTLAFLSPGWTGEKVCLAGDSAGGNLCVTTSMRAAAFGVRMPDGIVAAYPATLLTAYASPSRLLTLMDPLLPLSVLSRCLSAYAGTCLCICVYNSELKQELLLFFFFLYILWILELILSVFLHSLPFKHFCMSLPSATSQHKWSLV